MKTVSKNIIFMSALALLSHNTAFAQTVLYAEAPVATTPSVVSIAPKAQTPQFNELDGHAAQVIDLDTDTVTVAKSPWQSQTQDETRWFLKPEASRNETAEAPKNYAQEFSGLRTSVLSSQDVKIGTSTQYRKANDQPYLKTNRANKNLYSKTEDNFLLSAKLGF